MRIASSDSTYTLQAGRLMRIERAAGWLLVCEQGTLSVTQPGDVRDIELGPGRVMRIAGNGRVLVGGDGASFSLAPPPTLGERLAALLQSTSMLLA